MGERHGALGLKTTLESSKSTQQRQGREAQEFQERVRQAGAKDNTREQERQSRLAVEQLKNQSIYREEFYYWYMMPSRHVSVR